MIQHCWCKKHTMKLLDNIPMDETIIVEKTGDAGFICDVVTNLLPKTVCNGAGRYLVYIIETDYGRPKH